MKNTSCPNGSQPYPGRFLPWKTKPLMAMVEITNRCNLSCPVCFAHASLTAPHKSMATVHRHLTQLLEITDSPIPIQISGGEPTLHPLLPEIIAMAKGLGFQHIELVTNGIRISREPELLPLLREKGLNAVYLQFDGLTRATYAEIRGCDLTEVRHQAIANIRKAGLCGTLAVALTRGVNDHEIGEIIRFGIKNLDVVRAINFQAATPFQGRFNVAPMGAGFCLDDILQAIETQTGIPADTFVTDLIGHPHCNAMSYLFIVNGKPVPLFQYIRSGDLRNFLGKNRRQILMDLFQGKKSFFWRHLATPRAWPLLAKAIPIFGSNPRNLLNSQHILIFAKGFMNGDALETERLKQCCYAITCEKGVFSFCAYNNRYRFEEAASHG